MNFSHQIDLGDEKISKLHKLWWQFCESEFLWKIKKFYYKLIPCDYRPHEIWYKIKCWSWYRYTTIKSRYLGHTWCDRAELLPFTMFEILSDFIEKECSPGIVDWEGSGHLIEVNGIKINVREEMDSLYKWWHKKYNKAYKEIDNGWHKKISLLKEKELEKDVNDNSFFPIFQDEETEKQYFFYLDMLNKMEADILQELEEKMIRLIKVSPYMWT